MLCNIAIYWLDIFFDVDLGIGSQKRERNGNRGYRIENRVEEKEKARKVKKRESEKGYRQREGPKRQKEGKGERVKRKLYALKKG